MDKKKGINQYEELSQKYVGTAPTQLRGLKGVQLCRPRGKSKNKKDYRR